MTNSSVVSNALGTIGTVFWCVQLIPQIIRNYRKKDCEGFPPLMMFLWLVCGIPFGIYFISTKASIPVQVQPEVFMFFCSITWFQTLFYPPCSMSWLKASLTVGGLLISAAAFQGGMIYYFQHNHIEDPKNWRLLIFGIIASILLALGLIPPYFELAKRKGQVVGFNFLFLAVDCSGAIFSMLSVAFSDKVDIMGIVLYCVCAFLEIGLFTSHFIWCLRFKWFGKNKKSSDEEKLEENQETKMDENHQEKAEENFEEKDHGPLEFTLSSTSLDNRAHSNTDI